jgi:DNA polymerase III subunit gamma/tau
MSDSHVLARKFRPQTFDQVIGQDAITRTLSNALKSKRLHHAYLFTGARGVGKTTTARIFAKALNCVKGVTNSPCGECSSCLEIAASRSMDVQEIDAATYTKVEDTRDVIINTIQIAPARDRYKVFIIDEVHQLSSHSFNALLKTVEEPPPHVVFILATTDMQKVPETILSRCQIFEFRTITLKQIVGQLRSIAEKEGVEINDGALLAIARAGEGSMRDAESALDQVISFAGATVSEDDVSAALGLVDTETLNKTIQAIADQDSQQLVRIVDEVVSRGYDLRNFCREMMVHIRALLVVKIAGFDSELVQLPESEADSLRRLGESFSEQDLLRFFSILTKTEQDIKTSSQPRFLLEMCLVKLAQAKRLFLLEDALSGIQALVSKLGGGAPSTSTPGRGPIAQKGSRSSQDSTRSASPARTSAPPIRPTGGESSSKPQAQGQVATQSAEASPQAAAAVSHPSPRSDMRAEPSLSPEPPAPPMDDLHEGASHPVAKPESTRIVASSDRGPVDKIKAALEAKRKMMVVSVLDKGTITIDGDYLRVAYAPEDSNCKTQIEARDKRIAIEDACEQVLGRRLTLLASISGGPEVARITNTASTAGSNEGSKSEPRGGSGRVEPKPVQNERAEGDRAPSVRVASERGTQRKEKVKDPAEDDPKLQALVEKFHGEVIEVIKPEQ